MLYPQNGDRIVTIVTVDCRVTSPICVSKQRRQTRKLIMTMVMTNPNEGGKSLGFYVAFCSGLRLDVVQVKRGLHCRVGVLTLQ